MDFANPRCGCAKPSSCWPVVRWVVGRESGWVRLTPTRNENLIEGKVLLFQEDEAKKWKTQFCAFC